MSEIDRMQAQMEHLCSEDHHAGCGYGSNRCTAEGYEDASFIRALLDERTELLKDRERIDWIVANNARCGSNGEGWVRWTNGFCVMELGKDAPTLREAIDAAGCLDAATPPKSEEK